MTRQWKSRTFNSQRKLSRAPLRKAALFALEPLESRLQLSASLSLSGTQTITPGSVVNASNDPNNYQSEMSVTVNPTNPLNVAGFSHRIGSLDIMDVFYSTDGGTTWATTAIDENDDGFGSAERFDPTVAFDKNGRLFVGYGCWTGDGTVRVVVGRSQDGGANFDQFTVVQSAAGSPSFPSLDKWFLTTGADPISGNQAVYIAYTSNVGSQHIVISGSKDGGATFTTPTTVSSSGTSALFGCPAVGPNGALYVSWHDINGSKIYFDSDLDGLWGTTYTFGTDSTLRNLVNGSIFDSYVPAQPQRGIFTGPILTADRGGGTYNGRLYVAFVEWNNSSTYDSNIIIGRSSDQGSTWTFTTVDSSTGSEFLPWVDVDQSTGSANIIYYTSDGDQSTGNDDVKMRLATSLDGGANWTTANLTTITSKETGGYGGDYLDYTGLDVHDGTAHGLFSFRHDTTTDLDALTVAASFVNSNNTLTVNGDDSGSATNDTIIVQKSSSNTAYLEVFVNNTRQFTGLAASVGKIVINGLGGNDNIAINEQNGALSIPVTINGGDGNDTIAGSLGSDSLTGGAGNDSVTGNGGNDYFYGGDGDDTLVGGTGADVMFGEAGNDSLDPGDTGYNTVSGGLGNDTLDYSRWTTAVNVTLGSGSDIENLTGGSGNDTLTGNSGSNSIRGNSGNDSVTGGGGNDNLYGGDGDDTLIGGTGADVIFGEAGNDSLDPGDTGYNTVSGGAGNDTLDYSRWTTAISANLSNYSDIENLSGGSGNDTLTGSSSGNVIRGNGGNDSVTGNGGNDNLYGGDGDDTLIGGTGADVMFGEAGNDSLDPGDTGYNTVSGGAGNDTLDYSRWTTAVNASLTNYSDIENLSGGSGNDTLTGSSGANVIYGNAGDDSLNGGGGNDSIYGGAGNDVLIGGAGNDYLSGDDGDDAFDAADSSIDTLLGGAGSDSILSKDDNDVLLDQIPG